MDLEGVVLREISQSEKDNCLGLHSHTESKAQHTWKSKTETDSQTQRTRRMAAKERRGGGTG